MARRLNGWQRLWMVLAASYAVPVIWFTVLAFPSQEDLRRTRLYESIKALGLYYSSWVKDPRVDLYHFVLKYQALHRKLSDEQIIKELHDQWAGKIDFSRIEAEYKARRAALQLERARLIGLALAVWTVPLLLVYVLGIAMAWVIRGFRRENL